MRRHRLVHFLATVTALSVALVVLVGLLSGPDSTARHTVDFMLRVVAVTAALAALIGVLNLLAVHLGRVRQRERGWPYSMLVILSLAGAVTLRALDRAEVWRGDLAGEMMSARLFEAVQVSVESALAGLLVFFLVYAAYRLMRREVTLWHTLFTLTVVVVLLGWAPIGGTEKLSDVREWIVAVPAGAGARGILLGVALGTLVVGVRVLMGQDRALRG